MKDALPAFCESGLSIRLTAMRLAAVDLRSLRLTWLILLFVLVGGALSTHAFTTPAESNIASNSSDRARAQAALNALQSWYVLNSGLYRTTGWWNSANAITALANFSRVNHSMHYLPLFENTLHAAQASPDGAPGFLNSYYDDEGWWALAWIDVYDLTRNPAYLRMADSIFSDMQLGWDANTCGGGVWWSKKTKEKNAIENELFLAVAASLANRNPDAAKRRDDLTWAHKELVWFLSSGMINGSHLVNDGLDSSDRSHCKNNGGNTWSYNQGVILGGLVELDKASPDPELERLAASIALSAIEHLTDHKGILRETSDVHSGGDVPQFKGIFVRNLMILDNVSPDHRFETFIRANAHSVWSNDRDKSNHFGFWWAGPFDLADASRQSAVLDLLIAAEAIDADQQNRTGASQSDIKQPLSQSLRTR